MTTHEMRPERGTDAGRDDRREMETATGREDRPDTEGPMRAQRDDAAESIPAEPAQAPTSEPAFSETDAGTTSLDEPSQEPAQQGAVASTPATESTDQTLFADGELTDLRSRWTAVQSAFVDDPRDCVQKADGLVADVVDQLTSGFAHVRSGLEEQWSRGEEVSTEDLRIALQRYRDFFERLLAV